LFEMNRFSKFVSPYFTSVGCKGIVLVSTLPAKLIVPCRKD
jgi:hypothetical protein